MKRYFLKLAYDGSSFHGWQVQENAHSVQAELTEKLSLMLKEDLQIVGCGRTDTGVHAREFFAHFEINKDLESIDDFVYKLNAFLPKSIVVYDLYAVDNNMHARFSAKSRTYKYYISRRKNPFNDNYSFQYFPELNIEKMNEAAKILYDFTDFTSFSKLHTQTATNNCNVSHAGWELCNNLLVFSITADRFLRNMVRAIVGTLLEVGVEKLSLADFKEIIENKNRNKAGFSVPAKGLFLFSVKY
jgi:tRNA pseudouridine38-40 synthase